MKIVVIHFLIFVFVSAPVYGLDLLPNIFEREKVTATIWDLNEQYVRLVQIEKKAPPNEHPVAIDKIDLEQALASLQLWIEGGVLRDEESVSVYARKQAALLSSYLADALSKASPNEDVTFNVRGYADAMLSLAKRREWTTGRVFFHGGKLNLIIGEHRKIIDKAKKNVEGSFGIVDDFSDVYFMVGTRNKKGKMQGRIVTTEGVELAQGEGGRPDWITIDVNKAAVAYRQAQVPVAVRKEEIKAKAEAAKLTLERRQMREEMARMRKELQQLQQNSAGSSATVEERLAKLQDLLAKGLISEQDFSRRKNEILSDI